jgi:hypothetical protein
MEQGLLTLLEHIRSPPEFSGVLNSFVSTVITCLFVLFLLTSSIYGFRFRYPFRPIQIFLEQYFDIFVKS